MRHFRTIEWTLFEPWAIYKYQTIQEMCGINILGQSIDKAQKKLKSIGNLARTAIVNNAYICTDFLIIYYHSLYCCS